MDFRICFKYNTVRTTAIKTAAEATSHGSRCAGWYFGPAFLTVPMVGLIGSRPKMVLVGSTCESSYACSRSAISCLREAHHVSNSER
jgi:hypothetical protein